jgi:hypothetical protein
VLQLDLHLRHKPAHPRGSVARGAEQSGAGKWRRQRRRRTTQQEQRGGIEQHTNNEPAQPRARLGGLWLPQEEKWKRKKRKNPTRIAEDKITLLRSFFFGMSFLKSNEIVI